MKQKTFSVFVILLYVMEILLILDTKKKNIHVGIIKDIKQFYGPTFIKHEDERCHVCIYNNVCTVLNTKAQQCQNAVVKKSASIHIFLIEKPQGC